MTAWRRDSKKLIEWSNHENSLSTGAVKENVIEASWNALVDALRSPVELMLTPGQAHDLVCAEPLIENVEPDALLGDKAFDSDSFIGTLNQREITPVIPPKANRKIKRDCDFALYCERNLVERFFNKIKHFRAIATRYDKLAANYLAFVQLASIRLWLRANESTP